MHEKYWDIQKENSKTNDLQKLMKMLDDLKKEYNSFFENEFKNIDPLYNFFEGFEKTQ